MPSSIDHVRSSVSGRARSSTDHRAARHDASRCKPWRVASVTVERAVSVERETGDSVVLALSLDEGRRIVSRQGQRSVESWSRVGAVTVIPPGCRYAQTIEGPASALLFDISWPEVSAWLFDEGGISERGFELRSVQCGSDDVLARGLLALAADRPATSVDTLQAVIMRLADHHSNRKEAEPKRRASGGLTPFQIRRFTENIGDASGRMTIDDMMAGIGLSRFHFIRAFKATCGLTPYQHLMHHRTDRALRLLMDNRLEPQVVAERAGFSHASHMSRLLRRRFGITPGEFRRAIYPVQARWHRDP